MSYTAENIEILTGLEAIQKRAGMYIGDLGRLGAARLIQCAADVLAALSVNRDHHPRYAFHAFLDVRVEGRRVDMLIDHMQEECPDTADRCHSLAENCEHLEPDEFVLNRSVNSIAPIAVLSALTKELGVFSSVAGQVIGPQTSAEPQLQKDAFVSASFEISEVISVDGLNTDFLLGFLEGSRHVQALLVRSVSVS